MSLAERSPTTTGAADAGSVVRSTMRIVAAIWDRLFGPPRAQVTAEGTVAVRLLGRRFEAGTREGLFDSVCRERERLLEQISKMHEGAAHRPMLGMSRLSDSYHRDTQRIQDRVGLYTEFLGRLGKEIGLS
jgi:hypothetical protein